jgi:hypothetical protein
LLLSPAFELRKRALASLAFELHLLPLPSLVSCVGFYYYLPVPRGAICFPRFPFCLCVAIAKSKGRLWASICFPRFWVGLTLPLLLLGCSCSVSAQNQGKRAKVHFVLIFSHLCFLFYSCFTKNKNNLCFWLFLFLVKQE